MVWLSAPESNCFILYFVQFLFSALYLTLVGVKEKRGYLLHQGIYVSFIVLISSYLRQLKYPLNDLGENKVMSSDSVPLKAIFFITFTLLKFQFHCLAEKSFTDLAVMGRTQLEDSDGTWHREQSILARHICFQKCERW